MAKKYQPAYSRYAARLHGMIGFLKRAPWQFARVHIILAIEIVKRERSIPLLRTLLEGTSHDQVNLRQEVYLEK